MVVSCPPYGRWSHSNIHPLRWAGIGEENYLQYKDVCVRDMKAVDIDTMSWDGHAADRTGWRSALKQHLRTGEDKLMTAAADKRASGKEGGWYPTWDHTYIMCYSCDKSDAVFLRAICAVSAWAHVASVTAKWRHPIWNWREITSRRRACGKCVMALVYLFRNYYISSHVGERKMLNWWDETKTQVGTDWAAVSNFFNELDPSK